VLLIVTNRTDLASDYLILKLKSREIPFIRLNTESLGYEYWVDLVLNKSSANFLITFSDGKRVRRNDITSVYFRQPNPPSLPNFLTEADREFAERESLELLRSLWRMIPKTKWLNHPVNLWRATNKIEQLSVASEIGFNIPITLVSSNKDSVASFIRSSQDRIVAKAIKHGFLSCNNEVWVAATRRLPPDYIDNFESFAQLPMTYQFEIDKIYDLRVVVIDKKVFTTAIHSQDYEETRIDWRVGDLQGLQLRHEIISLPKSLENKCKKIVKSFSLRYSSMDLVLGKDGKYYFLELNPNGQWAWIEQLVGHPIREAIIDALIYRNG